jgi:hypothetical protein
MPSLDENGDGVNDWGLRGKQFEILRPHFYRRLSIDHFNRNYEPVAVCLPDQNAFDLPQRSRLNADTLPTCQIVVGLDVVSAHIRPKKFDGGIWDRNCRACPTNDPEYARCGKNTCALSVRYTNKEVSRKKRHIRPDPLPIPPSAFFLKRRQEAIDDPQLEMPERGFLVLRSSVNGIPMPRGVKTFLG